MGVLEILGIIGALTGGISSIAALEGGDRAEQVQAMIDQIMQLVPGIQAAGYSRADIENKILPLVLSKFGMAADVGAGRAGQLVGEGASASNVPGGQPFTELYTQTVAPIIAEGQFKQGEAIKDFAEIVNNTELTKQSLLLNAFGTAGSLASGGIPDTTPFQRGVSGFLTGSNIGIQGMAGIMDILTALSKQYPDLYGGSNIGRAEDTSRRIDEFMKG